MARNCYARSQNFVIATRVRVRARRPEQSDEYVVLLPIRRRRRNRVGNERVTVSGHSISFVPREPFRTLLGRQSCA